MTQHLTERDVRDIATYARIGLTDDELVPDDRRPERASSTAWQPITEYDLEWRRRPPSTRSGASQQRHARGRRARELHAGSRARERTQAAGRQLPHPVHLRRRRRSLMAILHRHGHTRQIQRGPRARATFTAREVAAGGASHTLRPLTTPIGSRVPRSSPRRLAFAAGRAASTPQSPRARFDECWAPRRHSVRLQGQHEPGRHAHHLRLPHAGKLRVPLYGHVRDNARSTRAASPWASSTWTSSPLAAPPSPRRSAPRTTPGTSTACRAAPQAALPQRSPRA